MTARNGSNGKSRKKTAPRESYIPCQVEPGMFNGEYLVTIQASGLDNPERVVPVRMLVDEREVKIREGNPQRGHPVSGLLRVEVVEHGKGLALLVFPQPGQPFGERAYVDEDMLEEAPA